jgi:2'-5' RNA ligase
MSDEKRLFFGAEIVAAWPLHFPPARIIDEQYRHMTLAFLGKKSLSHILHAVQEAPVPSFALSPSGVSRKWVFLPNVEAPRVIAADAEWLSNGSLFLTYQTTLEEWLKKNQFVHQDNRPFFPHMTIARGTFDIETWKKFPCEIPFYLTSIALQESLGYSHYKPVWRHRFTAPFEEIEHTADIAFLIRGNDFSELYTHASLALAFKFIPFLRYFSPKTLSSLDDVVKALNELITRIDYEMGTPFKAVSYHDEIKEKNYLEWKMIVDV